MVTSVLRERFNNIKGITKDICLKMNANQLLKVFVNLLREFFFFQLKHREKESERENIKKQLKHFSLSCSLYINNIVLFCFRVLMNRYIVTNFNGDNNNIWL